MTQHTMAVYLTADRRYLKLAWTAARRLAAEPARQFDVILFAERGHGLPSFVAPPGCILIEIDTPEVPKGVQFPSHLSPFIFARIDIVDTRLEVYRRLIYLDSDVRVVSPVSPLFKLDLAGATIAAVEDCAACLRQVSDSSGLDAPLDQQTISAIASRCDVSEAKVLAELSKSNIDQWRSHCARLGLGPQERYFNSGVLMIDTARWRQSDVTRRVYNFAEAHGRRLFGQDQDILNGVFAGQWAELSPRWNFQTRYLGTGLDQILQPVIFHYSDTIKPWRASCWPYEREHVDAFARLFEESPWPLFMKSPESESNEHAHRPDAIKDHVARVKNQRTALSEIVLKQFAADFTASRFVDLDSAEQRASAIEVSSLMRAS